MYDRTSASVDLFAGATTPAPTAAIASPAVEHRRRLARLRALQLQSDPSRRVLPWPYIALLLAELGVLVALVAWNGGTRALPLAYELGWAGGASMIIMHVYSLRRNLRLFSRLGPIRAWPEFHIFMGAQSFLFLAYHSLDVMHVNSLAGFALGATVVVVVSGMFGRYLFAMLPRAAHGVRLAIDEVRYELAELARAADDVPALASTLAAPSPTPDLDRLGLCGLIAADVGLRRERRRLRAELRCRPELAPYASLLERRLELGRRASTLEVAQRVFGHWTVFHRPLAFAVLGGMVLHVLAHFMFRPFTG
jgi:hypothetical protein